jgi:hypothetical protein
MALSYKPTDIFMFSGWYAANLHCNQHCGRVAENKDIQSVERRRSLYGTCKMALVTTNDCGRNGGIDHHYARLERIKTIWECDQ